MLLSALNQHAAKNGAPLVGYDRKTLGFVLHVENDASHGYLVSRYMAEEMPGGKSKMVASTDLIPSVVRTVKVVPLLGCDNATYVLGRPKIAKDPTKQAKEDAAAAAKRDAFDNLLAEYAEACDDEDARIFLRWRAAGTPGLEVSISDLDEFSRRRLDVDPIAIRVGTTAPLHTRSYAKQFWSMRATASKASGGAPQVCLSCGHTKPVVDTLPQALRGALIPATNTSSVALLSTNFPAASRGASGTGLKSAPVCVDCAAGAVAAFNDLAASKEHRWGARNDPLATIWWTTEDGLDLNTLEWPDPEQVAGLYATLERAREPHGELTAADRFYALTFSGNVARLVIRGWIDLPLTQLHTNVVAWFNDTAGPDLERPYRSVSAIARSCGSYTPSDTTGGVMPEGSRDMLLRAALTNACPAQSLLLAAIRRTRAEIHYLKHHDKRVVGTVRARMAARFALIRLTLNRSILKEMPMTQHLDEERNDRSYLSGRLFAVRESLQWRALGDVNATIKDRYFERASANPASVEHALAVLEVQHLRTLQRTGTRGAEVSYARRINELHSRRGAAPGRLSAEEQALWIAGYHQQLHANFQAASNNKTDAPRTHEED